MEQELVLKRLLDESLYYIRNSEHSEGYKEKAIAILDSIDLSLSSNTRFALSTLPMETFVRLAEIALESSARDSLAEKYVSLILQHFECRNQFYVRTLLVQALLEGRISGLKAEKAIDQIKKAWETLKKALEICALPPNKQKYQFLVYNASIAMWRILRPYIKSTWGANTTEILEKLTAIIEESDDIDVDWRCRLLSAQALALNEAGKKPEALKALDKVWDLVKKKGGCTFEETLIRMRIYYNKDNGGALGNIKKDCDTADPSKEYKHLFVLQQMKCNLIAEANVDKELLAVVRTLCPCVADYAEGKISEEEVTGQSLTQMAQDRIAEVSRLALKYGLIKLCEGCCLALGRAKQSSLRGKIWAEYSKAELVMKRPRDEMNKKTKMKKTIMEKIAEDTECRIDMLKQMDRAMIANNRLGDPDIILEGCYMIWNNAIPLLKGSTRRHAYKPLLAAATFLEKIQAVNESGMRAAIHLELAKHEIAEDFLSKAEANIKKALMLDYSLPQASVKIVGHEDDYPGDYQRVYERTLRRLKEQLELKLNIYNEPEAGLERFILDVENAKRCKSSQLRETLLSRTLSELKDFEYSELELAKDLVPEEKEEEEKKYKKAARGALKQIVQLATEIAKQAFEINAFEMTAEAAKIALQTQWEADKDPELILAQAEAHLLIAESSGELLLENGVEICYEDLVLAESEEQEDNAEGEEAKEFTEDQKKQFCTWKQSVCEHVSKAAQLAQSVSQSWLVCNVCAYLWNNYLIVLRDPEFTVKIYKGAKDAFKECYQAATKLIATLAFDKDSPDYVVKQKGGILAHVGLYYAKLEEAAGNHTEAVKICDDLLGKQLLPHLRKHFDALKASITKAIPSGKAPAAASKPAGKPGAGKPKGEATSKDDQKAVEVISYVELITNSKEKAQAVDMLKKAIDAMNLWAVDPAEEEDLELYAEQWTRLGQLAYKQNTPALMKTALVCAENACKVNGETLQKFKNVPDKRLRWYSLAKCLYGDVLRSLVDPSKQEKESQEQLLMNAVGNFVQGAEIAKEAGLGVLVLEAGKRMWNALLSLLESRRNRIRLVESLCKVTGCLGALKENSDPDFLALLYAATFGCITESKQWKLGEEKVEEAFGYVPQTHHRVLWEAKVLYMSKQGKNVFHAVSSMKEATASLQAKVWLKLARSSANIHNQFSAYQSAIDVLKKDESIEVVEVIIELAEWLLRNNYSKKDIEDELLYAADTLLAIDPKWEEEEDEIEESEPEGSLSRSKSKTKSRVSSNRSRLSKAKESKKRTDMKSKMSGKSRTSKRSVGRSTTKRSGVASSKKSSLTFTKRGEEEAQPLYLGCSHYDKLFRINVILAMLAENMQKQKEYIMRALNFAMYMWQSSFQLYVIRKFIEEHKEDLQQKHGYRLISSSNPTGPVDTEVAKQIISDILSSNDIFVPVDGQVPFDEQGWLTYNLPAEFLEWCKKYQEADIFSYWAFLKPSLSFYYMNQLLRLLENFSMQVQKIPVLKTLIAFADIIAKDPKLVDTYQVHLARESLRVSPTADPQAEEAKIQALLDTLTLGEEEKRLEYENIKLQSLAFNDDKSSPTAFMYRDKREPEVLDKIIRTHERWMLQANEHIYQKRFVDAKELLDEVAKHCKILNDYQNYAESMHMIGVLFSDAKQPVDAVQYHFLCEKYLNKIPLLAKSVCVASKDLRELHRYTEARGVLESSIAALAQKLPAKKLDPELGVQTALLSLHFESAILCTIEAKEYLTIPLRLTQLVKQSVKEYKEGMKLIEEAGGAYINHLEIGIDYINELNEYLGKVWEEGKREKKVTRMVQWLGKFEEIIVDLKCYKGVDPITGSKLKFHLDELMDRLNTVAYKIKGQAELLKAPPPPDPPKPKTEEEKVDEVAAGPDSKKAQQQFITTHIFIGYIQHLIIQQRNCTLILRKEHQNVNTEQSKILAKAQYKATPQLFGQQCKQCERGSPQNTRTEAITQVPHGSYGL
eukprot:TRINITY_DN161_c0_g1_i1.p1 TRINITY_DN161_c0_g1~~TRINITY_DN161_c0_g1_i1.p1  ORF type:complete len:1999 (+),score=278.18 TRINITY_DN161_c0_g1_i1:82-5997(+)